MMKIYRTPYVLLMVIGEFLILLSAGFVGYAMEHEIQTQLIYVIFLPLFLILGVVLRYFAEKCKEKKK